MTFNVIASAANEKIKLMDSLKQEKWRKKSGLFLVEGRKMIEEGLAEGFVPSLLLVTDEECFDLAEKAEKRGSQVFLVSQEILKKACDAITPQGIAAAFPIIGGSAPAPKAPLVILDGVQDPGNCGTIWRTCEAAGFSGVAFCTESAKAFSPKVIRASMGAVFRIPVITCEDTQSLCAELIGNGHEIIVSVLDGDDFFSREKLSNEKYAVVIGSEARGVSPQVAQLATKRYRLPMAGKTESLNAAVAASIIMYDFFAEGLQKSE